MEDKEKPLIYHRQVLDNGLRLICVPMTSVKSVTAMILVGAGSRYETKQINGISHFLEHMFFKGTYKRPTAAEISSLIDGIGGEFNAFTGEEIVGYYIKAPANHLELLLDVLSDMLCNSKFDPEEVEREKGVIIEELNLYEDTPSRRIYDVYKQLLYGDQPLGWDIGGRKEIIAKLTRSEFIDFMAKRYKPNNMVVVLAGDVDLSKAQGLVIKYFGHLQRGEVAAFVPVSENQVQPNVKVHYKETDQAHLILGVRTFPLTHPDRFKLAVLNVILGGGMSSRLFINVRERRGLAYYIRSIDEYYLDCGTLLAAAGVDLKRIDDAVKVILEEFLKMADRPVSDNELAKAKEYIRGRLILEFEDTKSVASRYGADELLEGKIYTDEQIIEETAKVTVDDVLAVAKAIFQPSRLNLAVIGPFGEEDRFRKLLEIKN